MFNTEKAIETESKGMEANKMDTNSQPQNNDDVFQDNDEAMMEATWVKEDKVRANMGYLEGKHDGRSEGLQIGFNRGFEEGAPIGLKKGMEDGFAHIINRVQMQTQIQSEKSEKK